MRPEASYRGSSGRRSSDGAHRDSAGRVRGWVRCGRVGRCQVGDAVVTCSHSTRLFVQSVGGAMEQQTCCLCLASWRRIYCSEAHVLHDELDTEALLKWANRAHGPAIRAWSDPLFFANRVTVLQSRQTVPGRDSTGFAGPGPVRGETDPPFRAVSVWHRALEVA